MVPAIRVTAGAACRWLARAAHATWPRRAWWILNYHDVSDDRTTPRAAVSIAAFRAQIEALRRQFTIIPLEEGFERLGNRAVDGRFASITFDDGYAGVVDNACPVMERLRVCGTVFVCGATLVEGREPWDLALLRILYAGCADEVGLPRRTMTTPALMQAVRRRWTPGIASALVEAARSLAAPRRTPMMTLATARTVDPHVLRIGNHTWSHAVISRLTRPAVVEEIGRTHDVLRTLPAFTPVFAYPFGQAGDMSGEATRLARDFFGLRVVSAYGGFNWPGMTSVEDARRVGIDEPMMLPSDLITTAVRSAVYDRWARVAPARFPRSRRSPEAAAAPAPSDTTSAEAPACELWRSPARP